MTIKARVLNATGLSARAKERRLFFYAFVSLGLVGCAAVPEQSVRSADGGVASTERTADTSSAVFAASTRDQPSSGGVESGSQARAEDPIAVIELAPMTEDLTPDMMDRLREVAEATKADERLTLWLEGFVPDGGSPVLNIGLSEQSLMVVRKHLIAMRVPVSRIQIIPFGEHHNRARSSTNHWVEIYSRIRDR